MTPSCSSSSRCYIKTTHATDQIQGLVCHDRSQGRILPHIHPSVSQEVPEVRFWGQSIPISLWASSGAPRQEEPSVPSRGLDILPPTRTVETVGLATEGAQLIDSGLSTEVVETILHYSAPSSSISECGPGKAQFALPSVGIRCLCPQSCPVV